MWGKKHAIRQHLRAQRKALSAAEVQAAGAAVRVRLREFPPYQTATAVVAYVAAENEIPTADLLDDAAYAHRELYLPQDDGAVVLVRWQPGERLVTGRRGVLQPANGLPAVPAGAPVVLVPMVAWDLTGTRLGRGGGFYDRLFGMLPPRTIRIGLAYDFQQLHDLPRDPWDIPLHYVITERRIIDCGCREATTGDALQKGGVEP